MKKIESDLIHELFRSVEVLGVDATTTALKVARCNTLTLQDKRVDFVLKMCANHYMQTIDEVIYSHSKSIKRMMALRFSVYYLYDVFGFSYGELKLFFKRDPSMLCKAVKLIKEESQTNPSVKAIKNKFDLLISDFKILNNL